MSRLRRTAAHGSIQRKSLEGPQSEAEPPIGRPVDRTQVLKTPVALIRARQRAELLLSGSGNARAHQDECAWVLCQLAGSIEGGPDTHLALEMLRLCPQAAQIYTDGRTTLHEVCCNSRGAVAIVSRILMLNPAAASQTTGTHCYICSAGWLPLHLLTRFNQGESCDLIAAELLKACPEAASAETPTGQTPIQLLCTHISETNPPIAIRILNIALQKQSSAEALTMLTRHNSTFPRRDQPPETVAPALFVAQLLLQAMTDRYKPPPLPEDQTRLRRGADQSWLEWHNATTVIMK